MEKKEITRMCIIMMGMVEVTAPQRWSVPRPKHPETAVRAAEGRKAPHWYDPWHDDKQAMALLKRYPDDCIDALRHLNETWPDEIPGEEFNAAICNAVSLVWLRQVRSA